MTTTGVSATAFPKSFTVKAKLFRKSRESWRKFRSITSTSLRPAPIRQPRALPRALTVFDGIQEVVPDSEYHGMARIVVVKPRPVEKQGNVAVVCAGTSDLPVAEEAAITAEVLGNRANRLYDVGVAGVHRLSTAFNRVAAFELWARRITGAAFVVVGLVSCPVIAVPTSVGYGASFGGLAALLCMLNSCASGVSVVNIDNGFGAGYQASLINKMAVRGMAGEADRAVCEAETHNIKPKLAKVS